MTIHLNKQPAGWPAVLALDIETTGYPYPAELEAGLDPLMGKILSISLSDGQDTWVFLHFHGLSQLKMVLEDTSIIKVIHNAKFDIKWIRHHLHCDVNSFYDTMLAEQIIDGGQGNPMGLDEILARRLGVLIDKATRDTFINHPGFIAQPITDEQLTYMVNDVKYLLNIRQQQLSEIDALGLNKIIEIEHAALPAFADMELNGKCFDRDLWEVQLAEFVNRKNTAEQQMRELLGTEYVLHLIGRSKGEDCIKTYNTAEINFNSPKQLLGLMTDRFCFGFEDTKDATLQIIASELGYTEPKHLEGQGFVKALLEYRKWEKRIGFDYPKYIHPVTGKIHPNIHQNGAGTGRVSVSKPNDQQIPRPAPDEPNMRHLWRSDGDDYVLIRADFSQNEPRILGQVSQDKAMIDACNTDDVYLEFAKLMYGRPILKTDPERFEAKTFVLAVGYGAGISKLSASSGLSLERCNEVRNVIRNNFPVMTAFASKVEKIALQYGYVQTVWGRRRYFGKSSPFRFAQGVNTIVQGTAADVFKLAVGKVYRYIIDEIKLNNLHPKTRIWSVIHDEIVVQSCKDDADKVCLAVCRLMEEAGHEVCPDVKHIAEGKIAPYWDK